MGRFGLITGFLLVGGVIAIRFPLEDERRENWSKRTAVRSLKDATPPSLELVHVSNIWRHGDRSPTAAMPGEKAPEELWTFGGGGWGELSPIGMKQHYDLGKKLYDRYAADNIFLSETYKAGEIFVHCTDKNRTIVSAMANMAGMYSRPKARVSTDYPDHEHIMVRLRMVDYMGCEIFRAFRSLHPEIHGNDVPAWPTFFVPIPIHTELSGNDHIGDPEAKCPRQDDLWKLVHQTQDYKDANVEFTLKTLEYLMEAIGVDESAITFDNIYQIHDNMLIENIWFPDNFSEWYPYYTDEVKDNVETIYDWGVDLINGIMDDKIVNGVDLTKEIPIIRGGPLLNDVVAKARGVMQCRLQEAHDHSNGCSEADHFYRRLKYHVISGHDTTLGAYLTVLGAKKMVVSGGYPHYSAAILTEFFIDSRNGGTDQVFRVIYHDSDETDFRVITPYVKGCAQDFCPVEVLQKLAADFAPPGGIDELCQQRIAV